MLVTLIHIKIFFSWTSFACSDLLRNISAMHKSTHYLFFFNTLITLINCHFAVTYINVQKGTQQIDVPIQNPQVITTSSIHSSNWSHGYNRGLCGDGAPRFRTRHSGVPGSTRGMHYRKIRPRALHNRVSPRSRGLHR